MTRSLTILLVSVGLFGLSGKAAAQTDDTVLFNRIVAPDAAAGASMALEMGAHLGPVIESYGPVIDLDGQDYVQPSDTYRVVFDTFIATESADGLNFALDSAARFLNMHAAAGVPRENMQVAVVLHGPATRAALSHEGYQERFGVDNPNLPLIEALAEAGVVTYVCGQATAAFGLTDDITEPARVVLSAMTAFAKLHGEGYMRMSW